MEISLRDLQLLELEIAKEIKKICDKNNIPYFLVGGTLLGAVRHEGFIPWDDDMDIGMLRENYNKFLECASTELQGGRFYLQTWDNDEQYGYPFAKVRLKNSEAREEINFNLDINSGIWVDVFPYDDILKQNASKKTRLLVMRLLGKGYQIKCGYQLNRITKNWLSKLANILVGILVKVISKEKLKSMLLNMISINKESCQDEYIIECDGMFRGNFVFPKQSCAALTTLKFETENFTAPRDYSDYLTKAYGDYMILPPVEDQQKGHSLITAEVFEE